MKLHRTTTLLALILTGFLLLSGCAGTLAEQPPAERKRDSIPFTDEQYYAVAYLGYQEMKDLSFYTEQYLDSGDIPTHYFSPGEFYLVIPRYDDMSLALYQNDIETMESSLKYEEPNCRPFIIQCNVSDIFPDATIRLTSGDQIVEFSPYISLKDGAVIEGERGLNITKTGDTGN